jgi:hypothetical protein
MNDLRAPVGVPKLGRTKTPIVRPMRPGANAASLYKKAHQTTRVVSVCALSEEHRIASGPSVVTRVGNEIDNHALRLEATEQHKSSEADRTCHDDARRTEIETTFKHRYQLLALEEAELIAEYVRILDRQISGQNVQIKPATGMPESTVGRPEGGIARAARVLCIPGNTDEGRRKRIERAIRIDLLCLAAKDAARKLHLDANQSALLKAAKADKHNQVATLEEIARYQKSKKDDDQQKSLDEEAAYKKLWALYIQSPKAAQDRFLGMLNVVRVQNTGSPLMAEMD